MKIILIHLKPQNFLLMVRSKYLIEVTITDLDTYDYNIVYVNIDGEKIKGEWVEFD